ncbi:TonB-dependent receptor [Polaribacter sp. Z014]|uniref:SusC/RagA family TonB-linked outer membrane protein n=1 Tax=Polaribacter sp. Z014 TaxID=2927126 RepID=UPI0020225338|nr:TonB-dependent receptor [Polaribacter sp. Z014]MCL7762976.1 TonB-dependent receptor [Polaribacter sp. Z014]
MNLKFLLKNKILAYSFLSLFAMLFCNFDANAQKITVKGLVMDSADNSPIPGASVLVKGTSRGTTTDFDGNYSISAEIGETLVFSYLGMDKRNVKVLKPKHNVKMTSNSEELEEIVVIGYGAVKKKELTGSVARVKAEAIESFVTPDLGSALQGQIAGVNITSNSGAPGESSSIQIRGITSLSGGNTPLFVVDGIPQSGDPGLSTNEIESIDILKDAASTAVYGTRGAAGVILITTKQGKAGVSKVSFNYSSGVQVLGDGISLMNTEEQFFYETQKKLNFPAANFNPGPSKSEWLNNDTDFNSLILNNAAESKSYSLNLSGGSKGFSYNVVGGLLDIDGALINSGFKRYNGRASAAYTSDNWKINSSIAFTIEDRNVTSNNLITTTMRYKPWFPEVETGATTFYSEEGSSGVTTPINNYATAALRKDRRKTDKINSSLSLTRKLTEDLNFITRLGANVTNYGQNTFSPKFELIDLETGSVTVDPNLSGVSAQSSRQTLLSWDGSFNYKKKFGHHTISALASVASEKRTYEVFTAQKLGVADNSVEVLDGAQLFPEAISGGNNYTGTTLSLIGRLQYNYKGKYLVSALVRRDGSSQFGSSNRWANFPSVSAAWNVSSENFWKPIKGTVNNLKLRLSRGTVGNDNFDRYSFQSGISQLRDYIFDEDDNSVTFGSAVVAYANQDVQWETSISKNIGIDLGFFKNKLTVTADYYVTNKEDMLFSVTLPGSAGVVSYSDSDEVVLNIGNMTNKGLEIAANYKYNIGENNLTFSGTFTRNRNEVTKMAPGVTRVNNGSGYLLQSPVTVLEIGREVGAFYLHETQGTIKNDEELAAYRLLVPSAELGDLKYTDQLTVDTNNDGVADKGDGVITDADRVYSGSGLPDFEYGFNFGWRYKGFDFGMNWYGTVGAELMNGNKADAYGRGRHTDLINMWTPDNSTSNIPFHRDRALLHPNYNGNTDLWLEDGDYLRLKLVTLGYTFPKELSEKMGLNSLRVFLSGQNLLTITDYTGFDPEVNGGNVVRRGLDVSRYPVAALYSLGVKVDF